jgi:Rrf2 family protein
VQIANPAKSDYATRALVAIAAADGGFVKAEALARRRGDPVRVPAEHPGDLRHAGWLDAQRGHDGGYRLAREADSITVSEVLDAVASPLVEPYARSGSIWDALETSTNALLGSMTVADLVGA